MPKIVVTGANGFIGQHLVVALKKIPEVEVYSVVSTTSDDTFDAYMKDCDVVLHLAGVNRPDNEKDFLPGNAGPTAKLVERLITFKRSIPIIYASSLQANQANAYGASKLAAEEIIQDYSQKTAAPCKIYRLKNVFGARCRPNYNSVIATFCHNITRGLPVTVNDPSRILELVWVGDVVSEFSKYAMEVRGKGVELCDIEPSYSINLKNLLEKLNGYASIRNAAYLPDMSDRFNVLLHSTFISYYAVDNLAYSPKKNVDPRGWLFELIRSKNAGQIFVSSTKPGFFRGNHYHTKKIEKFCVVMGQAEIKFRDIHGVDVETYRVDGENIQIIDIPTAYTHNIVNTGSTELITIFWANEPFDPEQPDTFFDAVEK